jgi:hypothetical protein
MLNFIEINISPKIYFKFGGKKPGIFLENENFLELMENFEVNPFAIFNESEEAVYINKIVLDGERRELFHKQNDPNIHFKNNPVKKVINVNKIIKMGETHSVELDKSFILYKNERDITVEIEYESKGKKYFYICIYNKFAGKFENKNYSKMMYKREKYKNKIGRLYKKFVY